MSVYAEDAVAAPPMSSEERLVVRNGGNIGDVVYIDERGAVREWRHGLRTVLSGETGTVLELSGVQIPDGVPRRHHHQNVSSRSASSQMDVLGARHTHGVNVNPEANSMQVERIVQNRSPKDMPGKYAFVFGIPLWPGVEPKVRIGEDRYLDVRDLTSSETKVDGKAFAVELDDMTIVCSSTAALVCQEENKGELNLGLTLRSTRDVLYIGAAVCDPEPNIPPRHELQISSTLTVSN